MPDSSGPDEDRPAEVLTLRKEIRHGCNNTDLVFGVLITHARDSPVGLERQSPGFPGLTIPSQGGPMPANI
jgi:hypothetical protein